MLGVPTEVIILRDDIRSINNFLLHAFNLFSVVFVGYSCRHPHGRVSGFDVECDVEFDVITG